MNIIYNEEKKDLPAMQLQKLFVSAGWSDELQSTEMLARFNMPFINSTLVISAWKNDRLVGVVRVLSDKIIRSVIYDFVVLLEYQNKGIGREMLKRCMSHFPNSEWLVQTTPEMIAYYEKIGFRINEESFLSIPSVYDGK